VNFDDDKSSSSLSGEKAEDLIAVEMTFHDFPHGAQFTHPGRIRESVLTQGRVSEHLKRKHLSN
jgi:hypothetical protein